MILIDADEVAARMSPRTLVDAMRRGHGPDGMGPVERILVQEPGGENAALTWTGWDPRLGIATKTGALFPGNVGRTGRPNIQSVVILFAPDDGRPLAAIHGESFTCMKTAADSALGVDLLAPPAPESLAVLGAGAQAETHVRFVMAMRPTIRRVAVWNRTPAPAEALAETLRRRGVDCRAVEDAALAVADAQVVTCLTGATRPVLHGAWLTAGCHVDLVGGYTPEMRESDDDVVRRGRLFADSRRFGVLTCGDYAQPLGAGIISEDDIQGDLFDLCSGRMQGRKNADDVTVFKNGGGGHLDLMAAVAFHAFATSEAGRDGA